MSGFSFSLFVYLHEWTEAMHNCKPFSAAAELLDTKDTYSWLSSAYRWWGIACPEIMLLSKVVWMVKSSGPNTDLWGTPKGRSALEDKQSPRLILWHLPVIHDLNQASGFPVNPKPIIKSFQENSMVYGIEGSRKVKQSQCYDSSIIHWRQNILVDGQFQWSEISCMQIDNHLMCLN